MPPTARWPVRVHAARNLTTGPRVLLLGEILIAYVRAYRLMRTTDLASALERLRAQPLVAAARPESRDPLPHQRAIGLRLGRATMLTLGALPTDKRCLVRSLVVSGLLARRGIPSHLVLGVRPDRDEPFLAHAWVEHDGTPVLPDEGYERLHAL